MKVSAENSTADVAGLVICESPDCETDAALLKNLNTAYRLKR